jgi:Fur family ferric uptake transcriptional regulator
VTGPGRATRQRAAIRALLDKTSDFRSAQELHDELRQRGEGVGLTTVYRTLQQMAAAGVLDTLRTDTGESVYRRC